MTWLIPWRSGVLSGFTLKTCSPPFLSTLTLALWSMTVGRRTYYRARNSRRFSHCLIGSKFWSSMDWMALGSSPVICAGEFNPWRGGSTMVLNISGPRTLLVWSGSGVNWWRGAGAPQEDPKGSERRSAPGPRVSCWQPASCYKLFLFCEYFILYISFIAGTFIFLTLLLLFYPQDFGQKFVDPIPYDDLPFGAKAVENLARASSISKSYAYSCGWIHMVDILILPLV
jgi:hypothetical protein